nr:MAG TPA: hypothetical protein [Caudoviricetes sp.]DAQ82162.1 MAG TPA: hypothetical protein [Caudoviricetes sp.]DAS61948.1 MAG TPA: hypothetical protein [Caudoviricetes sp.]
MLMSKCMTSYMAILDSGVSRPQLPRVGPHYWD